MSKFEEFIGLSILVLYCVTSTRAQVQEQARIVPSSEWVIDPSYQGTENYKNTTDYILAEFEKVYKTKGTVVEHKNYTQQVINIYDNDNKVAHRLVLGINAEDCDCIYTCKAFFILLWKPFVKPDVPDSIELNCVKEEERPQMRLGGQIAADAGYQETAGYKNLTGYILDEFEKVYKTKGIVVEHKEYTTQVIGGIAHRLVVGINAEDCDCVYTCKPLVIMRSWLTSDGPVSIELNCLNNESSFELLENKVRTIFRYILFIISKM
ncbi:hypothetical protein Ciccas_013050 [Cichlidogyrus casuarinus]|uniref:Cystatin domain-containing protein n=1 Tax=Cichlidogyrus casuarinus TaxID=1844966 RepID=A0ABD2PN21_9PLAT